MSRFLILLALVGYVAAIPVDNGLDGDPEVQCGSSDISVVFSTRNPFEGHVYVKGLYAQDGCKNTGDASITLTFDSCNVLRERSLEPRGVFVSTTLIVQFHPLFVTKVDQAITFRCFYMEADKTVSQDLEVSPLTTSLQTAILPMPTCQYDILDAPEGNPVKYVLVGQQVYHKWNCVTNTIDTFCMVVHSCTVDDGAGDKVELLDDQGCAIDKYLLRNLEYPTDLMAGQETHVFKYADRNQLFFQCQIALTIKEPGTDCPLPQCSALRRRVAKREADPVTSLGDIDVHAIVDALDLVENQSDLHLPASLRQHRTLFRGDLGPRVVSLPAQTVSDGFCLSPMGFALFAAFAVLIFIAAVAATAMLCLRNNRK